MDGTVSLFRGKMTTVAGLVLLAGLVGGCVGGETAPENGSSAVGDRDRTSESRSETARTLNVAGRQLQTELIFSDDFDDLDNWTHIAGGRTEQSTRWMIEDGHLIGRYGSEGASTLWSTRAFRGDVLIEFEGKLLTPDEEWVTESIPEGGKNLNFHFMVTGPESGDITEVYPELAASGTGPNGAGFDQYHGYLLTWTFLHARLRRSPGYKNVRENKAFLPALHTSYHFRLLRQDGRIRYWINDRLIFDYTDTEPWQHGSIGYTLWRSNVQIDNLKVHRVLSGQASH